MHTRLATPTDENALLLLYRAVAALPGGIAREADEITPAYIHNNLSKALLNGVCLVVEHPEQQGALVAELHTYKLEPRAFHHVLGELTVVVHPDFQGKGLGKLLFTDLLAHVRANRPEIRRVELITRESNARAIALYQQLGFQVEGRLEKRISAPDGSFEADIPMAWLR